MRCKRIEPLRVCVWVAMCRQRLFALSALITALSGLIFFFCGSAGNIDHRIDQRPLRNRHIASDTIIAPGATIGRPPLQQQQRRGGGGGPAVVAPGARARVAVDLSIEAGLSTSGYARLGS